MGLIKQYRCIQCNAPIRYLDNTYKWCSLCYCEFKQKTGLKAGLSVPTLSLELKAINYPGNGYE